VNTEVAVTNGQCRETGNIGYTRRRKTEQKHNTTCNGHHHTHTHTNNARTAKQFYMNCSTSSSICKSQDSQ
jgi:hypothetical protein